MVAYIEMANVFPNELKENNKKKCFWGGEGGWRKQEKTTNKQNKATSKQTKTLMT